MNWSPPQELCKTLGIQYPAKPSPQPRTPDLVNWNTEGKYVENKWNDIGKQRNKLKEGKFQGSEGIMSIEVGQL